MMVIGNNQNPSITVLAHHKFCPNNRHSHQHTSLQSLNSYVPSIVRTSDDDCAGLKTEKRRKKIRCQVSLREPCNCSAENHIPYPSYVVSCQCHDHASDKYHTQTSFCHSRLVYRRLRISAVPAQNHTFIQYSKLPAD